MVANFCFRCDQFIWSEDFNWLGVGDFVQPLNVAVMCILRTGLKMRKPPIDYHPTIQAWLNKAVMWRDGLYM